MSDKGTRPEPVRQALKRLELPAGATAAEVRQAYRFLRELYSTDSIATLPISTEMDPAERRDILEGIEAAYAVLVDFFEAERQKAPGGSATAPASVRRFLEGCPRIDGPALCSIREIYGHRLEEVAAETRIPMRYLRSIEAEVFSELPAAVFTRGFVVAYARFLGIEAEKAAGDFMARFSRWQNEDGGRPLRKSFRLAFWKRKK